MTKTESAGLKLFRLLENNNERRLNLAVKKLFKNPTHVRSHCNSCNLFSWKGFSCDSNKAKTYLRECDKETKNSISHQENESNIKKETSHLDLIDKLSTSSMYTGTICIKKEDSLRHIY